MKQEESALEIALANVAGEYRRSRRNQSPLHSGHEGYGVIREELDELWDEIKANRGTWESAYHEAKQVAATAIAYMIEVATDHD